MHDDPLKGGSVFSTYVRVSHGQPVAQETIEVFDPNCGRCVAGMPPQRLYVNEQTRFRLNLGHEWMDCMARRLDSSDILVWVEPHDDVDELAKQLSYLEQQLEGRWQPRSARHALEYQLHSEISELVAVRHALIATGELPVAVAQRVRSLMAAQASRIFCYYDQGGRSGDWVVFPEQGVAYVRVDHRGRNRTAALMKEALQAGRILPQPACG